MQSVLPPRSGQIQQAALLAQGKNNAAPTEGRLKQSSNKAPDTVSRVGP
jgi:hypothetical protein